jgi:hypothetical protein
MDVRRRRALAAAVPALAALALAGCGSGVEPNEAGRPVIELGYGQAIADLDGQLAGVARASDDPQTRKAADDLWRVAVRTAADVPKYFDAEGPVGGRLLTAAVEARLAAAVLNTAGPSVRGAQAQAHLRRSAAALSAAADALSPALPRSAAQDLERMRTALPPAA